MEKITGISEITCEDEGTTMSGFEVTTNDQVIRLAIDNQQHCCENFGYFWCNDNIEEFVGAELLSVVITDEELNEAKMQENKLDTKDTYFEGGVMFVNLETSKGTLQFVAYNQHNGYYGHMAEVTCKQLNHTELL